LIDRHAALWGEAILSDDAKPWSNIRSIGGCRCRLRPKEELQPSPMMTMAFK